MSNQSSGIFRAAAIERLSSPDQLEELVRITRPADWVATLVIGLAIAALVAWSIIGRIPTRVSGEGILIGDSGPVIDAVSSVSGRLGSVAVSVGDRVLQGQVIATVAQDDIEQRVRAAVEVQTEREREDAALAAAITRELTAKSQSFAAQKVGLEQSIGVAEDRASLLTKDLDTLRKLLATGLTTQPEIDQRRVDLNAARQRITDARNEILRLDAQKLDLETQRAQDRLASQFRVNDARRQSEQLAGLLARDTRLTSPRDGRVTEIKVSPGAVLATGTPVVAIEAEGAQLEAVIYIPAGRGKTVKPGMEVRIEPASVKREEYGTLIGTVVSISDFPATPQGMAAMLHNEDLVKRFAQAGALYQAVVRLERDATAAGGYRWSSGGGPPVRLTTGTVARAEVTTREQPPYELVVPLMRRLSGIDF